MTAAKPQRRATMDEADPTENPTAAPVDCDTVEGEVE